MNQFDDTLSLVISLFLLVAILIFTYFATKWLAKRFSLQGSCRAIKIIDKAVLGQDKALMVVRVTDQTMLLGITAHQIQKLCDIDEEKLPLSPAKPEESSLSESFFDILKNNLGLSKGYDGAKGDRDK